MNRQDAQRGSSVAQFALIAPVLLMVLVSLMSLVSFLYVRTLAYDAASQGARAGALSGGSHTAAYERTEQLLNYVVGTGATSNITVTTVNIDNVPSIHVSVTVPVPLSCPLCLSDSEVDADAYAYIE